MKNLKLHKAIYGLEEEFPEYSIHLWLRRNRRFYSFVLISLLAITLIFPDLVAFILFVILNFAYLSVQIFKLVLVLIGFLSQDKIPEEAIEFPTYSILLPVYKENKVIAKLINSINNLEYPKDLLDVKIIIEEDDLKTLSAIEKVDLPEYFEIIKVPVSKPRTKPKACNYALQFAKGKYVVVYDAEDRPDPKQLKEVLAKFAASAEDVICIQARLNFYNHHENYLTKLFATEYTILFDYLLKGLNKLDLPIPLGGTSNHFVKDKLIELGGWDAFNVTEDADLGIRLYDKNYKIELVDSVTLEESPLKLKAWIIQRSRWIKGHILTSLLHLKKHKKGTWGLYLFMYFPNLIYLLLPIYLLLWTIVSEKGLFDLFWQVNLILGIILPIVYTVFVKYIKKWSFSFLDYIFAIFYYWLLPVAGLRATWQILRKPFYWDKTMHGVSKKYDK